MMNEKRFETNSMRSMRLDVGHQKGKQTLLREEYIIESGSSAEPAMGFSGLEGLRSPLDAISVAEEATTSKGDAAPDTVRGDETEDDAESAIPPGTDIPEKDSAGRQTILTEGGKLLMIHQFWLWKLDGSLWSSFYNYIQTLKDYMLTSSSPYRHGHHLLSRQVAR
jgi:hypothetical protein